MRQPVIKNRSAGVVALLLGLGLLACNDRSMGSESSGDDVVTVGPDQDDTTDPGDGGEATLCGEEVYRLQHTPEMFAFVAERSSHMAAIWDHDENPNTDEVRRWKNVENTISSVVDARCQRDGFGLWLYPAAATTDAYGESACLLDDSPTVAPEPRNGDDVLAALPTPAAELTGASPARAAYENAIEYLAGAFTDLRKTVILLAHLPAQCAEGSQTAEELMEAYDPALVESIRHARYVHGIDTYVMGIDIAKDVTPETTDGIPDGVSPFEAFNDLAIAGGRSRNEPQEFFSVHEQEDLVGEIECDVGDDIGCMIDVDGGPQGSDPWLTEVRLQGALVPRVLDCSREDGWAYVNPIGRYDDFEFCGQACSDFYEAVQTHEYPDSVEVAVTYYCPRVGSMGYRIGVAHEYQPSTLPALRNPNYRT